MTKYSPKLFKLMIKFFKILILFAMCLDISTFEAPCENPPGIARVFIADVSKVAPFPAFLPNSKELSADIAMVGASDYFYEIPFPPEEGGADQDSKGKTGGKYVEQKVEVLIPGINLQNAINSDSMLNGRYIAIVEYVDGKKKVFGNHTNPLRSTVSEKSGKQNSDELRGTRVTLAANSGKFAPFYFSGGDITSIIKTYTTT